jgi:hypothetical protein
VLRPDLARAQLSASLDGGVAWATYEGYLPSSAYTLTPAVSYVHGPAAAYGDAALTRFESGSNSAFAEIGGTYTAGRGPLSIVGRVDGSDSWYRNFEPVTTALGGARAQLRLSPTSGVWLGGAAGISSATLGGVDDEHGVGRGDAGAWIILRPFSLVGAVTTTAAGDSTYTDAVATARFDVRRLGLSASGGVRGGALGGGARSWAQAESRVLLVANLSLVGAVGSTPTDITRGLPGAHFVSIGLHVTFGPTPVVGGGTPGTAHGTPLAQVVRHRTVEIHEAPGSRVEVMGDFTDWRPILCPEIGPGVFALAVPRTHGVYRIDVRVDGGPWTVPPGLASVPDDFGGEVGLLVVP